jgi:hypothetical protein
MGVHRRVRHGLRHCHGTSSTTSLREIDRAIRTLSPPVRVSIEVAQFFLGALPPTRIAGILTSLSTRKPPESLYSQHPCGAGKLIPNPTLQTCAQTYANIMSDDDLKTATHVVACPSSVCADQCSAEGASGSFNCFNNTKLMDMMKLAANERALAIGCTGSHEMNNMFMAGSAHHDCEAGHNHNDYMEVVSAANERKMFSFAVAAVAAGAALMSAA